MSDIENKVVKLVEAALCESSGNLEEFLDLLEEKNNFTIENLYSFIDGLGLSFHIEILCYDLLNEAKTYAISIDQLTCLLRVAIKMYRKRKSHEANVIPVWTGPSFQESPITYTTQATIKKLFQAAKYEVLIVGYTFSLDNDLVGGLFKELTDAGKRGCRIDIIFHKDNHNEQRIISKWPNSVPSPFLYYWKGDSQGVSSSLHSKLIIVDQAKLLITSANFTYNGLKQNIETGVLIERHQTIQHVWNQFRSLLINEEMVRL